ncbi:Mitochondrial fission protein [Coemansia sp. RSA 2049]|nr:Mitochondrial fission protein [Coemansia sp. RSA 2049]
MSIQRGRRVGGKGGKGNTDAEGSGTRSLYDYQQQAADIGTSSQNLVTRLINKILFRPGSQSLVGRLIRGGRGLDARTASARLLAGTARSGAAKRASTGVFSTDALLADAPAPPAGSVPLIAGFRSAIEKEHRRAAAAAGRGSSGDGSASASEHSPETQRRQRLPPDAWDVTPMLLSSEKFDALVDDTPRELRTQVLGERAAEYGEYLRRLELARNALAQRLDEMDLRIARAGEERRAVEERLETAELIDRRRRRSRTRSAGAGSRSQSGDPVSGDRVLPRTTVEDVSDTDELADDGTYYAQTDIPRLRKLLNVFRGHYAGITALACDPATDTLASGSLDTQVRVWDTESGECKHVISGHSDVIRGVQFYERFLLTASNDSRIRMWDLAMLESVRPRVAAKEARPAEYEPAAQPLGADPDDAGASLQSTTPPMTPTICRHVSPVELCCEITFVGHTDAVTCFQAAPDGTMISGSADKTVREWDLATGAMRQTIDITWAISDAQTLRASQRGAPRWAAAGAATKAARPPLPFDAAAPPPSLQQQQQQQPWESGDAGPQRRGTELADGGFIGALQFYEFALATGTADGFLRLWDLRTAQAHRQMHGHSQPITSLHFDDRSVVTASLDGSALIWDLRTGRVLQSLAFDSGIVADVRLAPSRTSGARGSSVEVWAAARDALLHRYAAGSMQRVNYAADRGYMNTGRGGGSLGDVCDGAAGFSGISRIDLPDYETLISGDDAGTIKLWSI